MVISAPWHSHCSSDCMSTGPNADARLSYLDAESVRGPFRTYRDVSIRNDEDGDLGRLDGIVVDAEARQVRYLVVATGGTFSRRRYLLPFSPTRVDTNRHALCVDAHMTDLVRCAKFELRAFHRFSDDDLVNALFADAR
jgi:PRC-barrel domain